MNAERLTTPCLIDAIRLGTKVSRVARDRSRAGASDVTLAAD
jgi:hypothetical protein